MDFTTIFIIWGIVLLAVLILVTRLAVRWAVRLVIVAVILIALVGGGLFWWWTTKLNTRPIRNKQTPAPTRRASAR
ncbi:MAG TPA: hypothetical protein VGW36_03035 [Pyrinomonadaceae bacterium]|nr:hypothetical protein [Pyrinomonadaceae bacterium]